MSNTILVVEGNDRDRLAIQRALQLRGYAVLGATTPPDAVLVAMRYGKPIRLLLVDAASAGMRLDFLVGEISATSPGVTVMLIGSDADWRPTTRYEHLPKPFTMPQLVKTVRMVLKHSSNVGDDV